MLLHMFNHQIVTAPEDDPRKDNWKTFVEDKPDVSSSNFHFTSILNIEHTFQCTLLKVAWTALRLQEKLVRSIN